MFEKLIVTFIVVSALGFGVVSADPYIVSPDGTYLGKLNNNRYDPDSVVNPYGQYGSKYSPKSINNEYGEYSSRYSPKSPNNPYATQAPNIYYDSSW